MKLLKYFCFVSVILPVQKNQKMYDKSKKRKIKKLFKRSGHDYRSIYGTSSAAYHSGDRQR